MIKNWTKFNDNYFRFKGRSVYCKVIRVSDDHFISKIKIKDSIWELKSFYSLFEAILWVDLRLMGDEHRIQGFLKYEY